MRVRRKRITPEHLRRYVAQEQTVTLVLIILVLIILVLIILVLIIRVLEYTAAVDYSGGSQRAGRRVGRGRGVLSRALSKQKQSAAERRRNAAEHTAAHRCPTPHRHALPPRPACSQRRSPRTSRRTDR